MKIWKFEDVFRQVRENIADGWRIRRQNRKFIPGGNTAW